jgi:hypothetical protein
MENRDGAPLIAAYCGMSLNEPQQGRTRRDSLAALAGVPLKAYCCLLRYEPQRTPTSRLFFQEIVGVGKLSMK